MFPAVNPFAESTWRNHAKPGEFRSFEQELLRIGGRHPNGHPMLRLQWAPHHYQIQLGRPRRYYIDTRIPTRRRVARLYYQVKDLSDAFASWITVEADDLGKYPGEAFLHVVHHDREIISIARQQWCIEQYFPPERLGDTPESWNERRFRFFTPPETNVPEFGDADGPFPSDGQYRLVFFIEGSEEYSYAPPCQEALDVLRASMQQRERFHRSVSRAKEVANVYAAYEERDRKRLDELDALLDDELKPYDRAAEGNAFISVP
jgi:hypothetical protein